MAAAHSTGEPQPHTRSATRAGIHPAPPPLFSPQLTSPADFGSAGISFGSIEAQDMLDVAGDVVLTSPAALAAAASARPASAVITTVSDLSALPASMADDSALGAVEPAPAQGEDDESGRWTPVSRKTSRSHRERRSTKSVSRTSNISSGSDSLSSSDSESSSMSTIAHATSNLSPSQLAVIMQRHEKALAAIRADYERKTTAGPEINQESVKQDIKGDVPRDSNVPEARNSASGHQAAPIRTHRVTVEEVEDEDPLSKVQIAGPSRDKGKAVDPRNWGDVASLHNFSEKEMQEQRDAFANYAYIKQIKEEEFTPHLEFSEEISQRPSSPKAKKSGKRSKSPKSKRNKPDLPSDVAPPTAPVQPINPTVEVQPAAGKAEPAVDSDSRNAKSVLTPEDVYELLLKKINHLESKQRTGKGPTKRGSSSHSESPVEPKDKPKFREATPNRAAALNFMRKALRDTDGARASAPGRSIVPWRLCRAHYLRGAL
ncbi:hypothetical protein R3P38DRAFT_2780568 [Favolaschia claudopus]|uniref:Uncharacterized protein n=1 Tax=Favolaschia claudopus TaxID=2862362 RepID=A0AAW0BA86_9AGAR